MTFPTPPLGAVTAAWLLAASIGGSDVALFVGAVLVGIFTLVRGRTDTWKSNYEAERERNSLLEEQTRGLLEKVAKQEALIGQLQQMPSLERLYEIAGKTLEAIQVHETRSSKTSEALLEALDRWSVRARS